MTLYMDDVLILFGCFELYCYAFLGVYTCEVASIADTKKISITHIVKYPMEGKYFHNFNLSFILGYFRKFEETEAARG